MMGLGIGGTNLLEFIINLLLSVLFLGGLIALGVWFVMKVFFQIVAWLGVLIIALAVSVAYDVGGFNVDMYGFGLMVAAIFCLVGVYLLLLGGFKSRSRFLWIITLDCGYSLSCRTSTSVDAP
jgi:hypothetical protein